MGIIFLDGDFRNRASDNLMEASIDELRVFYRLKNRKLTSEMTRALILNIRLQNKIKELEHDRIKI